MKKELKRKKSVKRQSVQAFSDICDKTNCTCGSSPRDYIDSHDGVANVVRI